MIKQKGKSQNGCFKKTKHAKFSEKRIFLAPWYAHVRVRNIRFLENLACFVFLKHPFWDSPFCLITDDLLFSREAYTESSQTPKMEFLAKNYFRQKIYLKLFPLTIFAKSSILDVWVSSESASAEVHFFSCFEILWSVNKD